MGESPTSSPTEPPTEAPTKATTYLNLGNGNCRDSNGLYPHGYLQDKVHTQATCQAQCDADVACDAFTIVTAGDDCNFLACTGLCLIYGAAVTSPPEGWLYYPGTSEGTITTATQEGTDRVCMKKPQ